MAKKVEQFIVPKEDFARMWAEALHGNEGKYDCMEAFVQAVNNKYGSYSHKYNTDTTHTNEDQTFDHKKARTRMHAMNKRWVKEELGTLPVLYLKNSVRASAWDATETMNMLMDSPLRRYVIPPKDKK